MSKNFVEIKIPNFQKFIWIQLGLVRVIFQFNLKREFTLRASIQTGAFGQNLAFSTLSFFLLGEVLASVQGNNEVGLWNMESQFRQLVLWASSSPLLSTNQSNSQSVTAMQSIQNHEMNVLITGNYLIYKVLKFCPVF